MSLQLSVADCFDGWGQERQWPHRGSRSAAFTLVELLVVIAIIGTLVGLLLPAVQAAREASRLSACSNNMKQLGLALHNYHDANKTLPYGTYCTRNVTVHVRAGFNWKFLILPYLEQANLFSKVDTNSEYTYDALKKDFVSQYKCPSNGNNPFSQISSISEQTAANDGMRHDYVGIAGGYAEDTTLTTPSLCKEGSRGWACDNGSLLQWNRLNFKAMTDGLSKIVMVGEISGRVLVSGTSLQITPNWVGGWAGPGTQTNVAWSNGKFDLASLKTTDTAYYYHGLTTVRYKLNSPDATANASNSVVMTNLILNSMHPNTVQVGMADGSVRAMNDNLDMATLLRLSWRADGQSADSVE